MKKLFLLATIFLSLNSFAGNEKGNGGDMCENKMRNIVYDIQSWLIKDQYLDLSLPAEISQSDFKENMLAATRKAILSCSSASVFIGESEKTCRNFMDNKGNLRIQCNFDRLMSTVESEKYRLIHHELAGAAGFEINNGDERSNYFISNQIGDFLNYKEVLTLGIKKTNTEAIDEKLCIGELVVLTLNGSHHDVTIHNLYPDQTALVEDNKGNMETYDISKLSHARSSMNGLNVNESAVLTLYGGYHFNVTIKKIYQDRTVLVEDYKGNTETYDISKLSKTITCIGKCGNR